jgi:branched-chain amino acid transport system ATP-binding protein
MTPATIYEVQDATLKFGGVTAISQINLKVRSDEILAIIGPNGAGKTSLLNALSGFYRPQQGKLLFEGQNVTGRRPNQLARLGVCRTFQGAHLFSGLTVNENIMTGRHMFMRTGVLGSFFRLPSALAEEEEHQARVDEILSFLSLESRKTEPISQLPFGIQKLVDLGRALAQEPRVLLLDEPMAGMDGAEKEALAGHLMAVRKTRSLTVVLIEHDLSAVMDLADRIVVMSVGTIIADGPPEEVRRNPDVVAAYIGDLLDE